jgi:hypothetical protein
MLGAAQRLQMAEETSLRGAEGDAAIQLGCFATLAMAE